MYLIYKYTNIQNGKVYIGQTSKTLEERANNGANYKECRRFYNAIKKYSWESFTPEVICSVETLEEANILESYYISMYKSTDPLFGYNIMNGGENKEMSEESRKIISDKAKARYKSKPNPMSGRKHSKETIMLQSEKKIGDKNPMYGTKWNETQRNNCGTLGKTLKLSDEQRSVLAERMRKIGSSVGLRAVVCLEDGIEFASVSDAAKYYSVSKSTMCGHLTGKQHTCKGKHFMYVDREGQTTIGDFAGTSEMRTDGSGRSSCSCYDMV